MAQTPDFIIDNGTGAEVRNDINTALMALATTNTGATPPQNPVFGMLWVDTTNACLKIYAGDDVWLIIIDSVVATATSGASSSFASGTKMVFHQVAIPAGWTQEVINDAALRVVSGVPGGGTGADGFSDWVAKPVPGEWAQQHVLDMSSGLLSIMTLDSIQLELKYVDVMICKKS